MKTVNRFFSGVRNDNEVFLWKAMEDATDKDLKSKFAYVYRHVNSYETGITAPINFIFSFSEVERIKYECDNE